MASMRWMSLAGALALASTFASTAVADDVDVQSLFREARSLMHDGDYEHAREKLEGARLASDGSGIKYNLAICYEMLGRPASAWLLYLEVAEAEHQSGDVGREQIARARAERVSARVSRIRVSVATTTTNVVVTRDATTLQPGDLGAPTPVDPGHHVIRASAPGHAQWTREIDLKEGETSSVVVPEMRPLPAPPSRPTPLASVGVNDRVWGRDATQRVTALTTGAFAGVSILVGGALFIADVATYSAGAPYCSAQNVCLARGVALRNDALAYGNAATVLLVAGSVGVVASLVLWFARPKQSHDLRAMLEF